MISPVIGECNQRSARAGIRFDPEFLKKRRGFGGESACRTHASISTPDIREDPCGWRRAPRMPI
jgi:hypothetical protein